MSGHVHADITLKKRLAMTIKLVEVCMDKDFSKGFMHDIADLLEYCAENNTDNVDLIFCFGDKELSVNIAFSAKQN